MDQDYNIEGAQSEGEFGPEDESQGERLSRRSALSLVFPRTVVRSHSEEHDSGQLDSANHNESR